MNTLVLVLSILALPAQRPVDMDRLEMGPPSYFNPIYFRRGEKPAPIPGYKWIEYDYGMESKFGVPDPGWGLFRTVSSPPNNRAVYERLGIPYERTFSNGRWDDVPPEWIEERFRIKKGKP